jgi:diguanylate cyclase (GGDEF)-like protein
MTELSASKSVILVVDDSRLMRVAARKILTTGFEIVEAADGEIAWNTLQNDNRIVLVMSDLSMPNLGGLELLEKIRTADEPRLSELPVIIITGAEDDDGSKKTALAAGASDFITKPFDSVQLLARTQSQLNQQRTREDLKKTELAKQTLEEHNRFDSLTGLSNAQAFSDRLGEDVSYAKRHRTELALIQIRIDKYKVLFLRKGKQVAEEILNKLAEQLSRSRRQEDTVARLSLDTFAILLPSANSIGARKIAETLKAGVEQLTLTTNDEQVKITVSIAVTTPVIQQDTTAAQLLNDGYSKLDRALEAGGDRIEYQLSARPAAENETDVAKSNDTIKVAVASPAAVHQALVSLSAGKPADADINDLARAVLPLLRSWNSTRNGRHSGLINQLENALQVETIAATPPETREVP